MLTNLVLFLGRQGVTCNLQPIRFEHFIFLIHAQSLNLFFFLVFSRVSELITPWLMNYDWQRVNC